MENEVFRLLSDALSMHLGTPSPHESQTGARFKAPHKGKATVYHAKIAPGNHAEVAFEPVSMACRLQMTEGELRAFLSDLRIATGRPVLPNPQFDWPRVGVESAAHVALIADFLRQRLQTIP